MYFLWNKCYNYRVEKVSINDIVDQKILKYDLYDVTGAKLYSVGEILTPGKIIAIKEYDNLYRKSAVEKVDNILPVQSVLVDFDSDNLSNHKAIVSSKIQREIINSYANILDYAKMADWEEVEVLTNKLSDGIINLLTNLSNQIKFPHEIKLIGKYDVAHPVNVALYSALLAIKMELSELDVKNITVGSLLHDIGKIQIPPNIIEQKNASDKHLLIYKSHTILGYKILKNKLNFSNAIARIALEHHETMDGSGWPYGISNTMISDYAQHVAVCNYYDTLTSSTVTERNPVFSAVLKQMLKLGSKHFSPKPLYTFVHMFNFSDNISYMDLLTNDY